MPDEVTKFDEHAILDIFGHQRYAGRVSEQTIGGASFIRIDVPAVNGRPEFTKLFGAASIYAITPCSEEMAILVATKLRQVPLSIADIPGEIKEQLRQLALAHNPKAHPGYGPEEDEEDDEDDQDSDFDDYS